MNPVPRAYRTVLADRRFRRLLGGALVSYIGDGMSVVAIAWLALEVAGPGDEGFVVSAAVTAYALPAAFGGLLLGRWLRRVPARRLLIGHAMVRAVMLALVATLQAAGWLNVPWYVVLLALSSIFAAWGSAGMYTLVTEIFAGDDRLPANSLLGTAMQATYVIGPAIVGGLAAVAAPELVIGLDALTYVFLAVQVARIPSSPSLTAEIEEPAARSSWALLLRHPELVALVGVTALFYFVYGPVEVALPLFVTADLGRSAAVLGLYWSCFGAGAIVGGLLGGLVRPTRMWPFVLGVVLGWGLILLPFGLTASVPITLACFILGGVVYGPFPAFTNTLFQSTVPAADLPAVLAVKGAVLVGAFPLGAALGGPLVAWLGASGTLFASGATTVALALLVAPLVLRRPGNFHPPSVQVEALRRSEH